MDNEKKYMDMKSLLEIMDDVLSQMSDEKFNEIWDTVDKECSQGISVENYLNIINSLDKESISYINEYNPNYNYTKINCKYINVLVFSSEQAFAA